MRKVILLAAILLVGINVCCSGQDVNVNIVYGDYGEFYINGISSTQDIGGVETVFSTSDRVGSGGVLDLRLTNYNNCMVTVLCVIRYRVGHRTSYACGPTYYDYEYFEKN